MSTAAEIQIRMAAAEKQVGGIFQALGEEVKRMTSTVLPHLIAVDRRKTRRHHKGKQARRQAFYSAQRFKRALNQFHKQGLVRPENQIEHDKARNDARICGEGWVRVHPDGRVQHIPAGNTKTPGDD